MIKHFVELVSVEGDFMVYKIKECSKQDFDMERDVPEGTNAIRFFDDFDDVVIGDADDENSEREPIIYFGVEYSIEEMKEKFPEDENSAIEFEKVGYKKVVLAQDGKGWYGLRKNDIVITK